MKGEGALASVSVRRTREAKSWEKAPALSLEVVTT